MKAVLADTSFWITLTNEADAAYETAQAFSSRLGSRKIITSESILRKLNKSPQQTGHLVSQLKKAFPEAWVSGYKALECSLENDLKDRHVLKHFPAKAIKAFDVEALHPDEFLVNQFYLDDALVTLKLTEQSAAIGRTLEQQLRAFHATNSLPLFTQADALCIDLDSKPY